MSKSQINSLLMFIDQYQLDKRTARFAESVITVCKKLGNDVMSELIVRQVLKSAASIGAKYAGSVWGLDRDRFIRRMYQCKEEAKTTQHWLRMLQKSCPKKRHQIERLRKECHRFEVIFQKIIDQVQKAKTKKPVQRKKVRVEAPSLSAMQSAMIGLGMRRAVI